MQDTYIYELPTQLKQLAAGRDNITTAEFATAVNKAKQTIRRNLCLSGHCYGIRPVKIGGQWQWPVDQTAKLLAGSVK